MAALAKEGFKPFVAIYSTFLQRAFDQVVHDVCLMDLPIVFAIDRAGIVGEDGETHQGLFDVSYLRCIPNMTIFAPSDENSLVDAVNFAGTFPTPCAFRYPRGNYNQNLPYTMNPFTLGKAQMLEEPRTDTLFIGYGSGVGKAYDTMQLLDKKVALLDLRFVKPLDKDMLIECSKKYTNWYIFSDTAKAGGVGSAILELLADEKITSIELTSFEYSDEFVTHGNSKLVEESLGLLPEQLAKKVQG